MSEENTNADQTRRLELERLAAMSDADIDTSDIPERLDWSGAEVGKFYRPVKTQITLRIDADVLAWFKTEASRLGPETSDGQPGGKYQTAINAALRKHMARERRRVG
ncbi:MAG: BrnA antitoxin family protein [Hyphomicrobium aestuarii]|nr:BrnA antitoxin family protein [Hyphomicrobium aestuarii]